MPWPPTSPTPGNLLAFEFASAEGTPCSNPLALTSCVTDPSKPVPCGSSCIGYGQVRACVLPDVCISRGSWSADQSLVRAFLLTATSLKWSGNSTARALRTPIEASSMHHHRAVLRHRRQPRRAVSFRHRVFGRWSDMQ